MQRSPKIFSIEASRDHVRYLFMMVIGGFGFGITGTSSGFLFRIGFQMGEEILGLFFTISRFIL